MKLNFPKDFYWGCATSSHQIEGNLMNDWTEWEKSEDRIAALEKSGKDPKMFISGRGAGSYEDNNINIACLRELGVNSYRWSLEWSRIEPRPGEFQEEVLEHYLNFCKKLRANGIKPFVTIWHWTNPLWIRDMGGWQSKKVLPYFDRYVKKIVEYLGDEVDFWITINEPQVITSLGYLQGKWPPQEKSIVKYLRVLKNLEIAHKNSYKTIKRISPKNQVGIASHNIYFEPKDNHPLNNLFKKSATWWWNFRFLNHIKNYHDFVGINYYFHTLLHYNPKYKHKYEKKSDMGWGLYPEGIYHVVKEVQKYCKPIYIMECGLADKLDQHREWYLSEVLKYLDKAIKESVDVKGFFYWSLIDNFEWADGFEPCFGLFEVNYQTLERTARPSAKFYHSIIKEGNR